MGRVHRQPKRSMNRAYFIDLDGTLFQSDVFFADFASALSNAYAVTPDVFYASYESSKTPEGIYSMRSHMEMLGIPFDGALLVQDSLLKASSYIFHDVTEFLRAHQNHMLILFSQGEEKFQMRKAANVESLGIPLTVMITAKKKINEILAVVREREFLPVLNGVSHEKVVFIDNMAHSFSPNPPQWLFQYRIRRALDEDKHATTPTPEYVTEVGTLRDIP